ncbi:MAG: hypothetical protein ACI81O_000742 [Cyclobacteriaceae bacterium]|jgi:uncharacterized protein (TIGR03643 family)
MTDTNLDKSRLIEMAWEDRTPFEAIESQFGLNESAVIAVMRSQLRQSSFKRWRKRVTGRQTKHGAMRNPDVSRGHCPTQYKVKTSKNTKAKR